MLPPEGLPLVHEAILKPFLQVAAEVGVPVGKFLERAGLPAYLSGNDGRLILVPQAMHFIESVTDAEGITNFGLLSCKKVSHPNLLDMKSQFVGCSNLQELLHRFIDNATRISSNARFTFKQDEKHVHFIHLGHRYINEDVQAQLFQTLGMIQIVRLVGGKNWFPDNISFSFERRREIEQAIEFGSARIHFSRAYASISIPKRLFLLPFSVPDTGERSQQNSYTKIPSSFNAGLYELLLSHLGGTTVNKTQAANILGLSPRTLQRRLSAENTSFLQIHNRARLNKAAQLLRSSDIKLVEIALRLGYENASSFTRAFHLWTGTTPSEYRRQLCELPH